MNSVAHDDWDFSQNTGNLATDSATKWRINMSSGHNRFNNASATVQGGRGFEALSLIVREDEFHASSPLIRPMVEAVLKFLENVRD